MSLVLTDIAWQWFRELTPPAKEQVKDFVANLAGRAYDRRADIIKFIRELHNTSKRSGPDADRGQVPEEDADREQVPEEEMPPARKRTAAEGQHFIDQGMEPPAKDYRVCQRMVLGKLKRRK